MAMGESTSSRDRPARWAKRIARIDTYSTAESVVPCRTRCHASDDARRHGCKAVYDPFNSWKSIPQDIPATTRAAPRTRPMRSEKARGEVRGSPPCGTLSPGMDEAETDAHEHAWTTMAAMQTTPQLSTTGTSASKQTEHPNARDDAMGTATSFRSGRASRHRFQSAWNASATAAPHESIGAKSVSAMLMRPVSNEPLHTSAQTAPVTRATTANDSIVAIMSAAMQESDKRTGSTPLATRRLRYPFLKLHALSASKARGAATRTPPNRPSSSPP